MALKDWKKTDKMEWQNKLNSDIIFIDSPTTSFIKDYIFVYPSDKKIKKFKTKTKALAFARSYMSKH